MIFYFFFNLHVSIIKYLSIITQKKLQLNHFECTVAKEKKWTHIIEFIP